MTPKGYVIRDPDTASQTLLDCFALHRMAMDCIWRLLWRYLLKPVLGGRPVLSGHYSIPRGCPLNTGFTVLAPVIFGESSGYTPWRSMYQRIVATAMNIYLLIGLRYIRIEGYIPLKLETVFFTIWKIGLFWSVFQQWESLLASYIKQTEYSNTLQSFEQWTIPSTETFLSAQ